MKRGTSAAQDPAAEASKRPECPKRKPPIYFAGWLSFRVLFSTAFRARLLNPERVPDSGPVILASNHASFMDPPLVGSSIRRPICYLARKSLFRFAPFGKLLRACQAVPIDRDGSSIAGLGTILDLLDRGEGVLLFPEGTRSHDGRLLPARSGIGLVAVKSNAPVVPVRVFGTFEAYGRQKSFPSLHPLAVKFGRPLRFDAAIAEAATGSRARTKEIYQEVAVAIMEAIAALQPFAEKDRFP